MQFSSQVLTEIDGLYVNRIEQGAKRGSTWGGNLANSARINIGSGSGSEPFLGGGRWAQVLKSAAGFGSGVAAYTRPARDRPVAVSVLVSSPCLGCAVGASWAISELVRRARDRKAAGLRAWTARWAWNRAQGKHATTKRLLQQASLVQVGRNASKDNNSRTNQSLEFIRDQILDCVGVAPPPCPHLPKGPPVTRPVMLRQHARANTPAPTRPRQHGRAAALCPGRVLPRTHVTS